MRARYRIRKDEECISCFRCIRVCPRGARTMEGDSGYAAFARMLTERLSVRQENAFYTKEEDR